MGANDLQTNQPPQTAAIAGALLEALQTAAQTLATTVAATVDSVAADTYAAAKWEVTFAKDDGSTIHATVHARHNGTDAADATTASCTVEYNADAAALAELTALDVDLDGAGTAQVLRLRATMTYASGTWKVSSHRYPMKPPQYA